MSLSGCRHDCVVSERVIDLVVWRASGAQLPFTAPPKPNFVVPLGYLSILQNNAITPAGTLIGPTCTAHGVGRQRRMGISDVRRMTANAPWRSISNNEVFRECRMGGGAVDRQSSGEHC